MSEISTLKKVIEEKESKRKSSYGANAKQLDEQLNNLRSILATLERIERNKGEQTKLI